jgi:hypothetical protein
MLQRILCGPRSPLPWALLATAVACATSEPVRVETSGDLPKGTEPVVFLVAARDKPRIQASLELAGFRIAADVLATPWYLRVTTGNFKGYGRCGVVSNVKYALRYSGKPVLELAASGPMGACESNAIDALSGRLYEMLEGAPARGGTP